MSPLDLHVLGTPPAFVLSQDQTLSFNPFIRIPARSLSPGRSLSELTVVLSCVFLCIVFKVRRPSRKELVYLIKFPSLCQPFFAFFSRFFECFISFEHLYLYIRFYSHILHIALPYVVELFGNFQNCENFSWKHIFSIFLRFII